MTRSVVTYAQLLATTHEPSRDPHALCEVFRSELGRVCHVHGPIPPVAAPSS